MSKKFYTRGKGMAFTSVLLALVMIFALSSFVSAEEIPFSLDTVRDNLNIRVQADTYSDVLTVIQKKGTALYPVEKILPQGAKVAWYKVRFANNVYGYVWSDASCVKAGSGITAEVGLFPGAALRQKAASDAAVQKMLSWRTEVKLTARNGNWLKAQSKGGENGWILQSSVSVPDSVYPSIAGNVASSSILEVVSSSDAKVRTAAKLNSDVIRTMNKGSLLLATESVNPGDGYTWYKTAVNGGKEGYIRGDTVKVFSGSSAFSGKVIVLDPGHGSYKAGTKTMDNGNEGNGVVEKNINLAVAQYLASYLRSAGATIVLTRTGDVQSELSLKDRAAVANNNKADALVSIHCNYSSNDVTKKVAEASRHKGAVTYYFGGSSKYKVDSSMASSRQKLANAIQSNLVSNLGAANGGVSTDSFTVLTRCERVCCLTELGYISSATDAALLKTVPYQQQCAVSLYLGLFSYLR